MSHVAVLEQEMRNIAGFSESVGGSELVGGNNLIVTIGLGRSSSVSGVLRLV
ncbi:MAG: hypothetical protein ACXV5N_02685 [Halobacteriota archaeon]